MAITSIYCYVCSILINKTDIMTTLKNRIKKEIEQVEKEMQRAVELNNHSYAQTLYFQDLMPLQKKLKTI